MMMIMTGWVEAKEQRARASENVRGNKMSTSGVAADSDWNLK